MVRSLSKNVIDKRKILWLYYIVEHIVIAKMSTNLGSEIKRSIKFSTLRHVLIMVLHCAEMKGFCDDENCSSRMELEERRLGKK